MNRPDCAKHKSTISHFGDDFEKLAEEIGDLRYDAMVKLFEKLQLKIAKDGVNDKAGGRHKLAQSLFGLTVRIGQCIDMAQRSWEICKPYMKEEKDNE